MELFQQLCLVAAIIGCIINDGRGLPQDDNPSDWQQWHWRCKSGHCTRAPGAPSEPLQQSPSACRLACAHYGPLWPRPTGSTTLANSVKQISPKAVRLDMAEVPDPGRPLMEEMAAVFLATLQTECGGNSTGELAPDTSLVVHLKVVSEDTTLDWNTDEGYALDLTSVGNIMTAEINSPTVFGARHALETLTQLMTRYDTPTGPVLIVLSEAKILDRPAYPHRGLMVDTARHFIPLAALKRTVVGMAASKMNVLHWHATDTQSFPLVSPRVPQLARFGAYSTSQTYRASDVLHLLQFARARGVRVVLEIDAPAHAGAGWQWGERAGLGALVACWAHERWRERCVQPPCGQLNPANPHVFKLLAELYRDIAEWMPKGELFHMGGDEVFFPCWNNTQEIIDLMQSRGMGRERADFLKLWAEYQATALRVWDGAANSDPPTPVVLWSSHLTSPSTIENFLPKERYVIQTWVVSEDSLPSQLSELGYRVIMSTKDAWYLDHGFWGNTQYHTWRTAYDNTLPRYKTVLGGEACMWTEYVDENVIDGRIWPRAAAVAERLWSDPGSRYGAAEDRMARHRERLLTRGLKPEALHPAWCYQNEGECS